MQLMWFMHVYSVLIAIRSQVISTLKRLCQHLNKPLVYCGLCTRCTQFSLWKLTALLKRNYHSYSERTLLCLISYRYQSILKIIAKRRLTHCLIHMLCYLENRKFPNFDQIYKCFFYFVFNLILCVFEDNCTSIKSLAA